jgi:RNA polymerase sigma-70 factor (ECF subfamily)
VTNEEGHAETLREREAVRRFVLRMVRDGALAEDLTQETFARATPAREGFRGEASGRSWLFAIALNLCRDHFRAAARRPDARPDPGALDRLLAPVDVEQGVLSAEMSACIADYLFRLPEPQRDVLALHDMAGLKHREIAAALGLSEANSRVQLHRGRKALRRLLERNCLLSLGDDPVPCERKPAPDDRKRAGR